MYAYAYIYIYMYTHTYLSRVPPKAERALRGRRLHRPGPRAPEPLK